MSLDKVSGERLQNMREDNWHNLLINEVSWMMHSYATRKTKGNFKNVFLLVFSKTEVTQRAYNS